MEFDTKWYLKQMAEQRDRKEYLEKCLKQFKFFVVKESIEKEITDLNRSIKRIENLIYGCNKRK